MKNGLLVVILRSLPKADDEESRRVVKRTGKDSVDGRRRTSKDVKREACMGNNKIPSPCGKSGGFCDRFFLFPLQWGSGLRGGGINKALDSHRTYKCFPLTLTLSPYFIRRPYGSPTGEGKFYIPALRYPLSASRFPALRCPLHAVRSTEFIV